MATQRMKKTTKQRVKIKTVTKSKNCGKFSKAK